MPPAASILRTIKSDWAGMWSLKIGEPRVVRTPSTSSKSLIATGMPASKPRSLTGLAISALAWARARSKHSVGMALRAGSTALIRTSRASRRSKGVISSVRKRAIKSLAVALIKSW